MAAISSTSKLFFQSQQDLLGDPVRDIMWRMLIPASIWQAVGVQPTNGDMLTGEAAETYFSLLIESATIPNIKVDTGKLNYMGFVQHHATNIQTPYVGKFQTKLLEDMRGYEMFVAWTQAMRNAGMLADDTNMEANRISTATGQALGLGVHKNQENTRQQVLRNNTIRVEQYNWSSGDVILRLNLINAMPTGVDGWALKHDPNASLPKFNFQLTADRWNIQIPKDGYKSLGYTSKQ